MKVIYASLFALANARSIINPKPYILDERPVIKDTAKPTTAGECTTNPWLLLSIINNNAATKMDLATTMKSLVNCKDNQHVREIFSLNYLMANNAALWNNLRVGGVATGNLVDLLQLDPKKDLKNWSDSKVFINMYKWKLYNDLYNKAPFPKYQYVQRKFDSFKKAKAAAEKNVLNVDKMEQFREWMPYAKPLAKAFAAPKPVVAKQFAPVVQQQYVAPKPVVIQQQAPAVVSVPASDVVVASP